ncbi:O-antigen ligase family protein [Silanimonas lenta]|uniref:O-antigen ligase family protein n=1 Tax=Silanimonas lenta TaxID=265429 RepID=UPI002FE178C0
MILRLLLAVLLVYTVNQYHFDIDLGIPGVNVINLVFGAALLALGLGGLPSGLPRPMLGGALRFYFLALALATIVAMAFRPQSPVEDLTYLKTLLFYPLYYFLFYYAVRDRRTVRLLVLLVLFVALVAGLEAIREGFSYGFGSYSDTHRASGPFGPDYRNANRAGVFYAMFLPLFAAPAFFLKGQPFWRLAALGGVLVLAAAILFTYSRQSYFIALLALLLVSLRKGPWTTLLCAAALAFATPHLPEGATQRVQETQQVGEYGEEQVDDSTASRWDIWAGALRMWSEHPMGVGANRFKGLIGQYSNYPGKDAHNYFVLTLAEAGIIGLFALLLLVLALWRLSKTLLLRARDPESLALAQGFRVAVLAMALGNLYGSPFPEGTVMGMFWALAALLERGSQLAAASQAPAAPARRPVWRQRGWAP